MADRTREPQPCPHGLILDTYGARCHLCDNPNYPMQVVGGLPIAPDWTDVEQEAIDRNRAANRALVSGTSSPCPYCGGTGVLTDANVR